MAGRQFATFGGLAAVGAGTYYLYNAGGDPKLAQKKAEHDAATASRKIQGELPGREKEAKKAGEEGYEAVRAKAQEYADQARAEAKKAEQKLDAYSQDAQKKLEEGKAKFDQSRAEAGKEVNAAANKFDKKVLEASAETKGWFSSWFK
jgi:septin family protein